MKTLTVRNLTIQFDCFDHENNLEATQEIVDSINEILQTQLTGASAQIFTGAITDSDIEIG